MFVIDYKRLIVLWVTFTFVIFAVISFVNSWFKLWGNNTSNKSGKEVIFQNWTTDLVKESKEESVIKKWEPTSENTNTNPNKEKWIPAGLDFVVYIVWKNARVKVEDQNLNKNLTDILSEHNISIDRVKKITVNWKEGTIDYKTTSWDLVLVFVD